MPTKKQIDRIRDLSGQGKSANEIQRTLSKEQLGIRRTVLLRYVREIKHKAPPKKPEKYAPTKYRVPISPHRALYRGKYVAVYGTVNGRSRRIQMHGSGRELYEAMIQVSRHPPRKKFLTVSASSISYYPHEFLDMWREWDEHPEAYS
jgi:hypothetical protein